MATATVALPTEPTTLFYYLEVKDGGIIQTYPGTAFEKRRKHVPHEMNIKDLRSISSDFNIENCGFQLVDWVSKEKDFSNDDQVEKVFYPEVKELLKKVSGCSDVQVISHMCRRATFQDAQDAASGQDDKAFVTKNNPARFVHVDQSYKGAEQILYLNLPEAEADRRTKKRWGIMNVWMPIENNVERDPLAFCDYRSLDERDLRTVVANLPPPGAGGQYGNVSKNLSHKQRGDYSNNGEQAARYEVANLAHNPNQQWYYASNMTPEEAWVFKIFDSKKDGRARCAVHSSFPLKGQGEHGVKPRQSIEVRCFVFWDDDDVE